MRLFMILRGFCPSRATVFVTAFSVKIKSMSGAHFSSNIDKGLKESYLLAVEDYFGYRVWASQIEISYLYVQENDHKFEVCSCQSIASRHNVLQLEQSRYILPNTQE